MNLQNLNPAPATQFPSSYEDRFCLFLDILGFKSHVDETVKESTDGGRNMTFRRLLSVLNKISMQVGYRSGIADANGTMRLSSRQVTQFSDSVIISYRQDERGGVADILYDVLNLQLNLIHAGILVRGAIVAGKLHHDEKTVFGPALNDAVELEKLAMYPRVVLDNEVLDLAGLKRPSYQIRKPYTSRTISSLITQDLDGLFYLDYFAVHPDDFNEQWDEMRDYLLELRKVIKNMSVRKMATIKLKHSWMRQKYNAVIEPLAKNGYKDFCGWPIPEDENFQEVLPFK